MSPPRTESPAKSHFSCDVITLVTGTTAGLIITLLASPLITRLYGPEAFGLVALFTSITGICGIVVCLRYEQAILLPESDEEAANVVGLCLIAGILISLLSIPVVILVQEPVVQFLKAPQLAPFLWLIPLTLFIVSCPGNRFSFDNRNTTGIGVSRAGNRRGSYWGVYPRTDRSCRRSGDTNRQRPSVIFPTAYYLERNGGSLKKIQQFSKI